MTDSDPSFISENFKDLTSTHTLIASIIPAWDISHELSVFIVENWVSTNRPSIFVTLCRICFSVIDQSIVWNIYNYTEYIKSNLFTSCINGTVRFF